MNDDLQLRDLQFEQRYARCEFEMIHDSLAVDDGGFRPGSRFSQCEMVNMLELRTLSEGSRVLHRPSNTEFVVTYARQHIKRRYGAIARETGKAVSIEDVIRQFYGDTGKIQIV